MHVIRVDLAPLTETTRVWVDGKELPRDRISTIGAITDFGVPPIAFEVGEEERHRIEVRFGGWTLHPSVDVFVDGQLHKF